MATLGLMFGDFILQLACEGGLESKALCLSEGHGKPSSHGLVIGRIESRLSTGSNSAQNVFTTKAE